MTAVRFLFVAMAAGACSEYDAGRPSASDSTGTSQDDTSSLPSSSTTATSADTGGLQPAAVYYSVGGRVSAAAGEWTVEPGVTTLDVGLYGATGELLCSHAVPVLSAVAEPPDTTVDTLADTGGAVPAYGWWRADLDDGVPDGPCPPWPSRSMYLGIGAYDHRLDPAMLERGMLDLDVYGLYVQKALPEDAPPTPLPTWLIGVAGTSAMFAGAAGLTVDEAPLPDGAYQLRTLVLLSIAD
ncbi:MAG: hypothetical protein ABMB14_24260 [Myxococcota bacterium]